VKVSDQQLAENIYANSTLALGLESGESYLEYYLTVGDFPSSGNPSGPNIVDGDSGKFLRVRLGDNNFVISKVVDGTDSSDKVTLFDGFGPEWLKVGEERDIGNTGYKFTLIDVIGFGGDVTAFGKIIDKSSGKEYPFNVQISSGVPIPEIIEISDELSFKAVLLSGMGFGDVKTARVVVGQEKTVADGDKYDEIFKWKVNYGSNTLEFGFDLKPENATYIDVGKSIKLPGSKISLSNLGLTLTDKDYLTNLKFKVVDNIDLDSFTEEGTVELSGAPIYVQNNIYDKIYFVGGNSNQCKIAYYNKTESKYTAFSGTSLSNVGLGVIKVNSLECTYSSSSSSNKLIITLEENTDTNGLTITFSISDGKVTFSDAEAIKDANSSYVGNYIFGVNSGKLTTQYNATTYYTNYGHKAYVTSDLKEFRLSWTPIQGYLKVALGEVTEKVVGGGTIKKLDVQALQVPVGKFDTEVSTDSSLTKNLIVIGSPIVNRVAAALLNLPYGAFEPTRDYYANIGAYDPATDQGKGFIQAFDNIFNSGKVAILVAGWRGEDTRLSGSVLQLYDKFLSDLNRNAVIIGGTRESPTFLPAKTPETSTEGAE
ncbi:MAG: hypothetical protein QXL97_02180, partial [Candidatus Aenigmatarchaeota archaeon]